MTWTSDSSRHFGPGRKRRSVSRAIHGGVEMEVETISERTRHEGVVSLRIAFDRDCLDMRETPFGLAFEFEGLTTFGLPGEPALPRTSIHIAIPEGGLADRRRGRAREGRSPDRRAGARDAGAAAAAGRHPTTKASGRAVAATRLFARMRQAARTTRERAAARAGRRVRRRAVSRACAGPARSGTVRTGSEGSARCPADRAGADRPHAGDPGRAAAGSSEG